MAGFIPKCSCYSFKTHIYILTYPIYLPTGDALLVKQMLKKQTGFVLLLKQNKLDFVFYPEK